MRLDNGPACEQCGDRAGGLLLTLGGRLLCHACRGAIDGAETRGVLQRLFRIRPRRGADGKTIIFERYEG